MQMSITPITVEFLAGTEYLDMPIASTYTLNTARLYTSLSTEHSDIVMEGRTHPAAATWENLTTAAAVVIGNQSDNTPVTYPLIHEATTRFRNTNIAVQEIRLGYVRLA